MADKYNPESLKEDAVIKKFILDTAVDVQSTLQLLTSKGIITTEELNQNYVIDKILGSGIKDKNDENYYIKYTLNTDPPIVIDRIHKDEIWKLIELLEDRIE